MQHCTNTRHVNIAAMFFHTASIVLHHLEETNHKRSLPSLLYYKADSLHQGECSTIKLGDRQSKLQRMKEKMLCSYEAVSSETEIIGDILNVPSDENPNVN